MVAACLPGQRGASIASLRVRHSRYSGRIARGVVSHRQSVRRGHGVPLIVRSIDRLIGLTTLFHEQGEGDLDVSVGLRAHARYRSPAHQ